ncbi:4485_t:CDS:2, partial [Racocetra persica]
MSTSNTTIQETRHCTRCKKDKPISEFTRQSGKITDMPSIPLNIADTPSISLDIADSPSIPLDIIHTPSLHLDTE